jgi:hypothetical protein
VINYTIEKITHTPGAKPPLTVHFSASGNDYKIPCNAGNVQTFTGFQKLIADRLGLWVSNALLGRSAKRDWDRIVETAIERGRME